MIPFRILFLVMLLSLFTIRPAQAAGVVIDCTQYGPGAGTLQDELASGGTITFTCSGTIIVPEIIISQDTTIDGTGQDVTLSGNNANQVFYVNADITLNLHSLTITEGYDRDITAIESYGTLTITDSRISHNNGPFVIQSEGPTTILRTIISNNEGTGIRAFDTLHIIDSEISDNTQPSTIADGGAVFAEDNLTIVNSVIANNSTASNGGGITFGLGDTLTISDSSFIGNSADLIGGAIFALCSDANVTITNSTFFDNSALYGGAIVNTCNLLSTNNTFLENTSSWPNRSETIHNWTHGVATFRNTIIAGIADGPHCENWQEFDGTANNLATDDSCPGFTQTTLGDLKLGTQEGDPVYFPLLTGSLAIDSGNYEACPLTDQRGISRPQGFACDVGAYEYEPEQSLSQPVLNTPSDGFSTSNAQTQFTWNPVDNATGYQFQIGTTNPPTSRPHFISTTSYTSVLLTTTYYWRVRGIQQDEDTISPWSEIRSLTIEAQPDAVPLSNIFTTLTPHLTWNKITWATGYEVHVSADSNFSSLNFQNNTLAFYNLSVTTSQLGNNVYYWRVRAKRQNGTWGDWGAVQRFVVSVP